MALSIIDAGGVIGLAYDTTTGERGTVSKRINRTGHTSVKGELVSCSTTADNEAILQANEYDTVAIVAEDGIVEGAEMWCWNVGSICQMLFKDTIAATRGNIAIAANTDGRCIDIANPGGGLPGTDTHFKEVGHVKESKTAGTNVLAKVEFHPN